MEYTRGFEDFQRGKHLLRIRTRAHRLPSLFQRASNVFRDRRLYNLMTKAKGFSELFIEHHPRSDRRTSQVLHRARNLIPIESEYMGGRPSVVKIEPTRDQF